MLSPALHGAANILDSALISRRFKSIPAVVFYALGVTVVWLPLVWLIRPPQLPALALVPFIALVALLDALYQYPYYRALSLDDTSTVSSLFALGKILVPLLAFLMVGEVLTGLQYVGFGMIIFGAAALTFRWDTLRFNRALFYMIAAAIIVALEAVLYKHIFTFVDWSTGFTWSVIFGCVFALAMLFSTRWRKDIFGSVGIFKKSWLLFGSEELLTFLGTGAMTYSISLTKVSLVEAIGAIQPFFVLGYAVMMGRIFPEVFKEKVSPIIILKKVLIFSIIGVGVLLILQK